jgi:predicted O-methyltransferase YrrM
MSESLQKHLASLSKILVDVGERVEGNFFCDISPNNITADVNKINNLRHLVAGQQKICEIGVNACHSFLFMLDANPTGEYALFDIGIHKYLEPCFNYLKEQFATTTMNLYIGDSKLTVPAYAESHRGEFDVCHIDGGHLPPEFTSDYEHCMILLKKGGILVFDDYDYSEIKAFIDSKLASGEVIKVQHPLLADISAHILLMKV